ncbi:MAG: hypothetical protein J5543_01550 [Bacteroidales bacterium]|jgi:hypothetical protein|nr:hypothetical protein [Bacteroidales bacterium]
MEEKNNMTAERSLEIITKQIEQSRQAVAKDTGISLYVAGLCLIAMSLLIGLCIFFTNNMAFYLLYIASPIPIYFADRYAKRNKPKVPASFVGQMVDKTWQTFGIFAVLFFVFVTLYNLLMGHTESPDVYMRLMIHPFRIILLLFGMAITINGYTLKSRWMVWCGIIGGIGGFIWESFYVTQTIVGRFFSSYINENYCGIVNGLIPGIIIALLAFIGIMLPGMMLKKQSL